MSNYQSQLSETIRALKAGMTKLRYTDPVVAHTFQLAQSQGLDYVQTLEMALLAVVEVKDNTIKAASDYPPPNPIHKPVPFPDYVESRYIRDLFAEQD